MVAGILIFFPVNFLIWVFIWYYYTQISIWPKKIFFKVKYFWIVSQTLHLWFKVLIWFTIHLFYSRCNMRDPKNSLKKLSFFQLKMQNWLTLNLIYNTKCLKKSEKLPKKIYFLFFYNLNIHPNINSIKIRGSVNKQCAQ